MKEFITGSNYFFEGMPDFKPHDKDIIELHDELPYMMMYENRDGVDVFKWKRSSPKEYIEFLYKHGTPLKACTFLIAPFVMEVGFTIKDLKMVYKFYERAKLRHTYFKVIADAYIANGDFVLTDEQRQMAFEEYLRSRK